MRNSTIFKLNGVSPRRKTVFILSDHPSSPSTSKPIALHRRSFSPVKRETVNKYMFNSTQNNMITIGSNTHRIFIPPSKAKEHTFFSLEEQFISLTLSAQREQPPPSKPIKLELPRGRPFHNFVVFPSNKLISNLRRNARTKHYPSRERHELPRLEIKKSLKIPKVRKKRLSISMVLENNTNGNVKLHPIGHKTPMPDKTNINVNLNTYKSIPNKPAITITKPLSNHRRVVINLGASMRQLNDCNTESWV